MTGFSRRTFLHAASATALCTGISAVVPEMQADGLNLPLGLQLYSVRDLLPKDYAGTLRKLGALGYREVEAAGFFGHSASEVKRAVEQAGLRCVSAHYPLNDLLPNLETIIQYGNALELDFIVCASPMLKDFSSVKGRSSLSARDSMTLEDWRWNAEQFNRIGEKVSAAGMRFAYHNHTPEFGAENGIVFYDELIRATDPAKVSMELDCGWAVVAGASPAEYLTRYPSRFSMLHVKDFKVTTPAMSSSPPSSTELGRGTIDYRRILQAAKNAALKHAFVEQEEFDLPAMQGLQIDADYMRGLKL